MSNTVIENCSFRESADRVAIRDDEAEACAKIAIKILERTPFNKHAADVAGAIIRAIRARIAARAKG
ncbi:MAG: hypothetical protein U1E51_23310 [Candidatus Binatia bacterium]|nr:hypothetical protein [Candidatus Binatia bacterium]